MFVMRSRWEYACDASMAGSVHTYCMFLIPSLSPTNPSCLSLETNGVGQGTQDCFISHLPLLFNGCWGGGIPAYPTAIASPPLLPPPFLPPSLPRSCMNQGYMMVVLLLHSILLHSLNIDALTLSPKGVSYRFCTLVTDWISVCL